jgi:urate oxidase
MFIPALFIIAEVWEQYRCPKTDECIKKMWNLYIMEYSNIKKVQFAVHNKWMELVSQSVNKGNHEKIKKRQVLFTHDYNLPT